MLSNDGWNHNNHYHDYLLKNVPQNCSNALDIGCGNGDFSRLLSQRSNRVLGVDFSLKMIEKAKQLSEQYTNIEYKNMDILEYPFEDESYDCIASIATMHHLPLESLLKRVKQCLNKGGALIILDLYQPETLSDFFTVGMAVPLNLAYKLFKRGRMRLTEEECNIWKEHGEHDKYLTIREVEKISNSVLPGAKIKRHLFWRYSLIWEK